MAKKSLPKTLILLFLLFLLTAFSGAKKKSSKDLPQKYKLWLDEEVVYIITPKEKEVFLQLETDKSRDLFIEAFWRHRDPDPTSLENEFKTEHYRRIAYANKWLGRGTSTVGWRTDMGRIHIILGEPKAIERHENLTEVYPSIVWFYQGMGKFGLPDAFNVVFFKKYGAGDYEIYSPIKDGPQNLLIHYLGDPRDYLDAYEQLKTIRPELASVSLSLIPGEPLPGLSPTTASEILISNIEVKPQKAVKDQYAEKLLKFKDIIEVEYSANYIDNDHLVTIIPEKPGICYVHYLIEPAKLSVNRIEDTYNTTLEISGKISDLKGKTIYQFNKSIPIEFREEQLKKVQSRPFSLQDTFPLIEGNYKFNLLLKNRASKEFTSIERDISVSSFQSSEEMTTLILAPSYKSAPSVGLSKAFKIEDTQLYPSARNEFSMHDTLYIFFLIPGISEEIRETSRLEFVFYRENQEFLREVKEVKTYPHESQFLEEFSLENFPPAFYRVEVSLLSKDNEKTLTERAYFSISAIETVPRPFIYSQQSPSTHNPVTDYILGGQHFNKGNHDKAKYFLEKAYRKNPNSLQFAEGFSRILLSSEDFEEAKKILLPFLESPQKDYKFLKLLGQASQNLSQFAEALDYFKQYLGHYGTNLEVLNAIGFCYASLGNKEEALRAWEKSLEINPNQEKIKKLAASLKGEK